ncbi:MAG TPA: zinc-dependent metalloprotease [Gemmatimonadales bacterium]|nr:zinc-dependent metalloprotease [Gemmatimonadales bacterium]
MVAMLACAWGGGLTAQIPTIGEYARSFEKRDGYFPLYWDATKGRLLLEVPRVGEAFLLLPSLATGVGDVDLGLDRGTIGDAQLARFERTGPRVTLVLENPGFRPSGDDGPLARSVRESFARSTLGAFDVLAQEDDRQLVDITPLVVSDVMDVRGALRGQGTFTLDRDRSTVYLPRTKGFPRNTELEATLTFASDNPGRAVRAHTPEGRAVTLRQHLSLVRLPAPGYRPRRFDPRIGLFAVSFWDYAKPFDQDPVTRYIVRHRLEKRDPTAALSEPVQPIVYYLDPGVPEPYRSAFREGAMWWNRVFEAAGFKNAFRLDDMPAEMDPMDARYNVIQWVHRDAPGYSIGPSFVDPRTGEIIKAAVRMESERSLSDYNLYAGTQPARAEADWQDGPLGDAGLAAWLATLDTAAGAAEFVMARRRQHAAHEVGHTLGLAHNFIAAADGRASVMAYPAPLIRLVNGRLDVSQAYRNGPGVYDSLAIRYAYTPFAPGDEAAGLEAVVEAELRSGVRFITNPDESPDNSYPEGTTWVNGKDAVEELARVGPVRRFLIDRFDERAIAPGEPMALLSKRFTAVYLHHRFTLDAAVKAVGGMEYRYAVRGDTGSPTVLISPARQRRALELLLDAVQPRELAVPERILRLLAPTPFGYDRDPWTFASAAAPAFDQLGAARALATQVIGGLLAPARAARLAAFHDRDVREPGVAEVVDRIVARTWSGSGAGDHPALVRVVQRVVTDELIRLAGAERATPEARAAAEWGLRRIARLATGAAGAADVETQAHRQLVVADITRFLERRDAGLPTRPPVETPPGAPIGAPRR